MAEGRIISTIAAIPAQRWNACVAGVIEDHAALLAIEQAGLAGFEMRYLLAEEDGRLLAAAPVFISRYPLDTMLEGRPARAVRTAGRIWPSIFSPRLACIGSPCTETAGIGFAPEASPAQRRDLAELLLALLDRAAVETNCALLGIKDLPAAAAAPFKDGMAERNYHAMAGQPRAWLPIDFADVDAYLGMLSRATRRDLRRKLRARTMIRIERCTRLAHFGDHVFQLYSATRARARHSFEELTPSYFTGMLEQLQGKAFCTLYFIGDELLGANLLIEDGNTLLDKYWCMARRGQEFNLYYLSWITNIQHCLTHGLTRYEAGQASADLKRRLGCRFERSDNYVRHRNRLCSRALGAALPYLGGVPAELEAA